MAKKKSKLTDADWRDVYRLRCRSKQGITLEPNERRLIIAAHREDAKRYADMNGAIFEATKPFGAV
jgi:hypothetical protein